LNSIASDINEIWTALAPLLMFTSPIFYSLDMLSPWGRAFVFWSNPLTPYILCYQTIIAKEAVPYFSHLVYLQALVYALIMLGIGFLCFKKLEKQIIET